MDWRELCNLVSTIGGGDVLPLMQSEIRTGTVLESSFTIGIPNIKHALSSVNAQWMEVNVSWQCSSVSLTFLTSNQSQTDPESRT